MQPAPIPLISPPADARSLMRVRTHGFWHTTTVRLVRHPTGVLGVVLVGLVVLGALCAPLIVPAGPLVQVPGEELGALSRHHPFGTDEFGRDILSRVLYGARISVGVGLLAVGTGALVGVAAGVIAGYVGGAVDAIVTRLLDVLLAFPPILMGIAITVVVGTGAKGVGIAIGVASIPDFARIARAATLTEREREYVAAARALGAPPGRIMGRHLLPNIVPPLLVQLSVALSFAVLLEAGLSFLGIGVQPPAPSWGSMLQVARTYLYQVPSYAITVGLTLALVLIGFNFIADALRDILDPRLNRELR